MSAFLAVGCCQSGSVGCWLAVFVGCAGDGSGSILLDDRICVAARRGAVTGARDDFMPVVLWTTWSAVHRASPVLALHFTCAL